MNRVPPWLREPNYYLESNLNNVSYTILYRFTCYNVILTVLVHAMYYESVVLFDVNVVWPPESSSGDLHTTEVEGGEGGEGGLQEPEGSDERTQITISYRSNLNKYRIRPN